MDGVFDISGNSRYDDFIAERYHFPNIYLAVAERLVGDWIVYRETRAAGGRMAYIGAARVDRIEPDPRDPTHSYARVDAYFEFDRPVLYRSADGRFAERILREMARPGDAGRTLRGASVRALDREDFVAIVAQGLGETLDPANRIRLELDLGHLDDRTAALLDEDWPACRIEQVLLNRNVRDANFRNHVLAAYENTCAITGLCMVNGGGKAEAQAAHIRSVADGGPDIVQNGIALSATAHWLFDRHLVSLDEELRRLVSHNCVPSEFVRLFPPTGERIRLPSDRSLCPRPDFVAHHRERFAAKSQG